MLMNSIMESERSSQNDGILLDPKERITLESNYIQNNIHAFKNIRKRNYQKGLELYKECYGIAEQLRDNYKINDSLSNYSISLFNIGNVKEALENLEKVFRSYTSQNMKANTDLRVTQLNVKIISNLVISNLCVNKLNEASNAFKNLIELINIQTNNTNKKAIIKEILYIFFRVESIVNYKDSDATRVNVTEADQGNPELHKKIIKKIISAFHAYNREENIDLWIKCLNTEVENLKTIKDYNGVIFCLFHSQICSFSKGLSLNDSNLISSSKHKLLSLIKALVGDKDVDEKNIEKMVKILKDKNELISSFYRRLYDIENQVMVNYTPKKEEKSTNLVYIKLLLKNSLRYIHNNIIDEKLKSQLKAQIDITMNLINKNEIDLSNLKLRSLSPEILKSLTILTDNLATIHEKSKKKQYFNKYKIKVYAMVQRESSSRIKKYLENFYIKLMEGDSLTKINYKSTGKKVHFYQLDSKGEEAIKILTKRDGVHQKSIYIDDDVVKFTFGVCTDNLKKKVRFLGSSDQPWCFMSIIIEGRSFDLYGNENVIKKWIYGLNYYLTLTCRRYKILSSTKYALNRIKLKMASHLISSVEGGLINELPLGSKIKKLSLFGDSSDSFTKVLLMYNKLKKL